jgi:polyisoprenoid-binding protein YceI
MKKLLPFILAVLLSPFAGAAPYAIQPDKSALTFTYKQMGVPVDGRFRKFAARIDFDAARPAAAKADIDVDLASIDTGLPEADQEVAGKDWFDVKNFPQAKFVSTSVKSLGANRYEATGKMTLHGHTQDMTAPFTFTPQGSGGVFEGSFVLKRADFGVGRGAWADFGTVANEIQIKFRFPATAGK